MPKEISFSGLLKMGSQTVRLYHDHVLVKEPRTTAKTPWHQDQPYYCIDGTQNVSFWIPLDPVPRESTLEFVAGSQAAGTWYMPRSFVEESPMVFEPGALAEVPDVEASRDEHEILASSSPATRSPSTCSPCTPPPARAAAAGRSRCD